MPHKRKPKQAAPPPQASSSSRRFSFDWFSDTEAYLAEALARADASSMLVGGGTPPQLPSPLLESLPLPSAVLGPEFRRLDRAFDTVNPRFLNFESDDDALGEGSASPLPPASSAGGGSGASPPGPGAAEIPLGPSPLHDAPHVGGVLSDTEIERRVDAALGPLYPPPPPAPYTDGAPGASLWNPDIGVVSVDTVHPHRFLTCDHHLPPWEHPPHRSARRPATSDGV
jgi:hypothetical protein